MELSRWKKGRARRWKRGRARIRVRPSSARQLDQVLRRDHTLCCVQLEVCWVSPGVPLDELSETHEVSPAVLAIADLQSLCLQRDMHHQNDELS